MNEMDKRKQMNNQRSQSDFDRSKRNSDDYDEDNGKEAEAQKRMKRLHKQEEHDLRLAKGEEVILEDSNDDDNAMASLTK